MLGAPFIGPFPRRRLTNLGIPRPEVGAINELIGELSNRDLVRVQADAGTEQWIPWARRQLALLRRMFPAIVEMNKTYSVGGVSITIQMRASAKAMLASCGVDAGGVLPEIAIHNITISGLSGIVMVFQGALHFNSGTGYDTQDDNIYMLFNLSSDGTSMTLSPHVGLSGTPTYAAPSDPGLPLIDVLNPAPKLREATSPYFFPSIASPADGSIRSLDVGLNIEGNGFLREYSGSYFSYGCRSNTAAMMMSLSGGSNFAVENAWAWYLVLGGSDLCFKPSYKSTAFTQYASRIVDGDNETLVSPNLDPATAPWAGFQSTLWYMVQLESITEAIASYIHGSTTYGGAIDFDIVSIPTGAGTVALSTILGAGAYVPIMFGKNNFTVDGSGFLDRYNISLWLNVSTGAYQVRYRDVSCVDDSYTDNGGGSFTRHLGTWLDYGSPITYLATGTAWETCWGMIQHTPVWCNIHNVYMGDALIDSAVGDTQFYLLGMDSDHLGRYAIFYAKYTSGSPGEDPSADPGITSCDMILKYDNQDGNGMQTRTIRTTAEIYLGAAYASCKLDQNCILLTYNVQAARGPVSIHEWPSDSDSTKHIGILNLMGDAAWTKAPFLNGNNKVWSGSQYQEWIVYNDTDHKTNIQGSTGDPIATPWTMWWSAYSINRLNVPAAIGIMR